MTSISMIGQRRKRWGLTVATLLLATATMGCGTGWMAQTDANAVVEVAQEPMVSICVTPVTVDVTAERGWGESRASYHSGEVEHLALYLEDPFEEGGSNDGYFQTWSLDDALAAVSGPGFFFGQTVCLGVAAVVAPPWQEVGSDGHMVVTEPAYALPATGSGVTSNERYE